MKFAFLAPVLASLSVVGSVRAQRGPYASFAGAELPGPQDPVLAGYDLVEYHNLDPSQDGVVGRVEFSHRHTNGYLYYFANDANKRAFIADPERYLPQYGGFCAWGVAWEYSEDGWPWAADHMGPPCGPRDGWAVIDGKLYCSIWRSYQDDFNRRSVEGIRLADERWIGYYGSLSAGPQNNGCYAWNWQECFARSIYKPGGAGGSSQAQVDASQPSSTQTDVVATTTTTTTQPTPTPEALFTDEYSAGWSSPRTAMEGIVTWRWTLDDVATVNPKLIVEMEATDIAADEYVAFGVAEQLMQGALVVCSEMIPTTTMGGEEHEELTSSSAVVEERVGGTPSATATGCTTLVGEGMGTTVPRTDPVRPVVLLSSRNDTHYTVRFSANLFGCWATPDLPARVLFARGGVSGNGAPQPHVNDGRNREAIPGIEFLSVVDGYDSEAEHEDVATSDFAVLEPLPSRELWDPIPGTAGATDILDDRVRVKFEMFDHEGVEIILVELQDVEFVSEETYIGFGFAEEVMTGLVLTCAPRRLTVAGEDGSGSGVNATCHQWRGRGTNLLPRRREVDPGGWFVLDVAFDGTHVNYTLAGRVAEVVQARDEEGLDESPPSSIENLRAICAIGRSAPQSGTPLMHDARDREAFLFYGEVRSARDEVPRTERASVSAASSLAKWFGGKFVLTLVSISFLFHGGKWIETKGRDEKQPESGGGSQNTF